MSGQTFGTGPQNESALDAQLGPFSPPADFDHGPEFQPACPRPIPAALHHGRYVRGRNAQFWIPTLVGAACWVTDLLPFVQQFSSYLLVLGYLQWIGAAFMAIAAWFWLRNRLTYGSLNLVRSGQPLTGRIRQVYLRDYNQSEALQKISKTHFVVSAEVEFPDPGSGQLVRRVIVGRDAFQYKDLHQVDAGVKPGDYVTLVYVPGQLDKSLQIYGWLGVNPDVDFLRKSDQPLQPMTAFKVLLVIGGLMALIWLLLGFLYVLGRYMPYEEDTSTSFLLLAPIIAAALLGVLVAVWRVRQNPSDETKTFGRYGFAVLSGSIFGAMCAFITMAFVNGAFDHSSTHLVPIRVVQLWHETIYELGVRTYQVEFEPFPKGSRTKKTVTIETLKLFQPQSLGVLDVGKGLLGIPWIRDIRPITWRQIDPATADRAHGAITFRPADAPDPITIAPVVILTDESVFTAPDALLPELHQTMLHYLKIHRHATILE